MSDRSNRLPWYQRGYRRMLVDMHIPDWDEAFLSRYDPDRMTDLYEQAGLTSVMFYCQSHVGLCYWPTKTGKMHAGLKGRDVVGDLLAELKQRGLASCAYYSVVFNNWAFLEHPEWRVAPVGDESGTVYTRSRYGHCCPNNPGYREFALAQTEELITGYDFDGIFFDMTFWPGVCACRHCRDRFAKEAGIEIPTVIDWFDPGWCRFQTAREDWMTEFAAELTGQVKSLKPEMSVYHNFATSIHSWQLGLSFKSAVHHDFLGADFYGDPLEQLLVSKLMLNLTEHQPVEFMTSRCANLQDHVQLKSEDMMMMQAFAATLFSSAFLFIDAINLDGTVNPAVYERIHRIFEQTSVYEPFLGEDQVEDIAVYFSSESKMDFAENGNPLIGGPSGSMPHMSAVRGACRILQKAHLPFGVITRKQLPDLSRYRVVVLPNVLRMDQEEVDAFRQYVRDGGRLYASGYTSLTESSGVRHPDFMLSDLFGCHFAADDIGRVSYLRPVTSDEAGIIEPQDYVSHVRTDAGIRDHSTGMLRLDDSAEGEVLFALTLPYASPKAGSVMDHDWASIHSSPPWEDTPHPAMIRNRFGSGTVIYSAADIESVDSEVNDRLFISLMESLLDGPASYSSTVHPAVWMNVMHQPDHKVLMVGFLNYQSQLPAIPIDRIPFKLRAPEGTRFMGLVRLPDETPVPFMIEQDGTLCADLFRLEVFDLLRAEYELA